MIWRNIVVTVYLIICIYDFMIVPIYYEPFTLKGGGLFHLSFGAIITGSVFGKKD